MIRTRGRWRRTTALLGTTALAFALTAAGTQVAGAAEDIDEIDDVDDVDRADTADDAPGATS